MTCYVASLVGAIFCVISVMIFVFGLAIWREERDDFVQCTSGIALMALGLLFLGIAIGSFGDGCLGWSLIEQNR